MPRVRYRVSHTTTYSYDEDVTNSFGIAHVTPRELPHQHVETTDVDITPAPADQSSDVDFYGNTVTYFQVLEPHQRLEIAAVSEVEVSTPVYDEASFDQPWERARPLVDPGLPGAWRAADLAVASPLVEHTREAYDFGAVSLTEQRPLVEAAEDLMHRIHAGFDYDDTATTVTSTIPEIFEAQGGVCQDFAHLMLACFRAHGLAARYVSGYLATTPPPGKPRLVGADASHAWVEVWLPHYGADLSGAGTGQWLALDPTNDTRADDRYVSVAWGRDYADVPPVKGVIYTEATTSTLTVSVDVAPDQQE
ncbi:transglutaminase N-terminal domain-containing protein [Nocardioides sp. NPDC059952]|uniref:transglutaminase family protein n=1 Tax=Nocardioides sp. NPDC059952 TaxID=3347014 RepID=UPI0036530DE9